MGRPAWLGGTPGRQASACGARLSRARSEGDAEAFPRTVPAGPGDEGGSECYRQAG